MNMQYHLISSKKKAFLLFIAITSSFLFVSMNLEHTLAVRGNTGVGEQQTERVCAKREGRSQSCVQWRDIPVATGSKENNREERGCVEYKNVGRGGKRCIRYADESAESDAREDNGPALTGSSGSGACSIKNILGCQLKELVNIIYQNLFVVGGLAGVIMIAFRGISIVLKTAQGDVNGRSEANII